MVDAPLYHRTSRWRAYHRVSRCAACLVAEDTAHDVALF